VVLLSAEDGVADTIRPRLDAAGANVERILALATVPNENGHDRLLSMRIYRSSRKAYGA
jgi:hypothetical protein